MPIQSKHIALSALGIAELPGLVWGNHLRIGFNPLKGFPACGFKVFKRRHQLGAEHSLDIPLLFQQQTPATFRWGYRQGGLNVYHDASPRPIESAAGGISITDQSLQLSFRATPFLPDSNPKVCEVRLRIRSAGTIVVEAFDDRHDGTQFSEILVARERRSGLIHLNPGLWDRLLRRVHGAWSRMLERSFRSGEIDRLASPGNISAVDLGHEPTDAGIGSIPDSIEALDPDLLETLAERTEGLSEVTGEGGDTSADVMTPTRRGLISRGLVGIDRAVVAPLFSRPFRRWEREHDIVLRADLISLVRINAPAGSRVLSVQYTELSDQGWQPVMFSPESTWGNDKGVPLLLPTADQASATVARYPTCPGLRFSGIADEIEKNLPAKRLQEGFVAKTGPADVRAEYFDFDTLRDVYLGPDPQRPRFSELSAALDQLQQVAPGLQHQVTLTFDTGSPEETISIAPLSLILAGSVDIHFARLIGLAAIDMEAKREEHFDYKVVAEWEGVEHAWITHDVFPGRDGKLAEPGELAVNTVLDYTRPGGMKTNVELEWDNSTRIERLDRAKQYAGFHLFRQPDSSGSSVTRLTESTDELLNIEVPHPLLLAETQGEEPVPASSADQGFYVDRPAAYGRYKYGLQAEDLFGRRSEIVWTNGVEAPDLVDPPPVSDLYGYYYDADDPDMPGALEEPAIRVLNATNQNGLAGRAVLVEFRYPKASVDAVSGDIESFRLSFRMGRPNEILGTVESALIVGPPPAESTASVEADVVIATAIPVDPAIDDYVGLRARGTLSCGGEHFVIVSAQVIDAQYLGLRVKARRDYLPQLLQASVSFGPGNGTVSAHALYRDPRDPTSWSGFDLRHPQESDDQGSLLIAGGSPSVLAPPPTSVPIGDVIVSRRLQTPADDPGDGTAVAEDWVYRIVIRNIDVPLPDGLGEYFAALTVQAVTGAGRPGPLPAPAHVRRRIYESPQPLQELASDEFIFASRPDFQGRIGVKLTWPKTPGIREYKVYRVEAQRLVMESGTDPDIATELTESAANRAALTLMGGQQANARAYTLLTPVPLAAETDPGDLGRHRWIDLFPAPREGAYLYRVQPVSTQGVEADWPADSANDNENRARCVLALQRNRDRLLPPSIYALEPMDRAVRLEVRKPEMDTVNGMRIYKTDDPTVVDDVRNMTLIHGTITFSHPRLTEISATDEPTRLQFTDQKVTIGIEYYYRVKWVDDFGNESEASAPMAVSADAFAPPEPPTLQAQRVDDMNVQLSWQVNHSEGQVRLQRKRSGSGLWEDVMDVWHAPTDNATDGDATGNIAHRLLLRDAKGRVVYSQVEITGA